VSDDVHDAPTQLAPGIHRLGNEYVNCYLLEEGNDLTLVDGGFPAFRHQLDHYLQERGRSVKDISAIILTHAHSDHVGMVESVRRASGATVHVHAADEVMARTGKSHEREGNMLPYLRYPALYKLFLVAGRNGGARAPDIEALETFDGEQDLDVPGRPRVIPTPGHSPGHVAFHLPEQGVLIAGDALCTYNPLTGKYGPQLMPKAFAADSGQALASLAALERIDATLTLFGHGEPWTAPPRDAVAQARERGLT
jgi:glyoxylase-like metal-dependent hydrolase (beta-lactamase superfamily II)